MLNATETYDEVIVEVGMSLPEAPYPACWAFSGRVKSVRTIRVVDSVSHGRRWRLLVRRRAFRCITPDSVGFRVGPRSRPGVVFSWVVLDETVQQRRLLES